MMVVVQVEAWTEPLAALRLSTAPSDGPDAEAHRGTACCGVGTSDGGMMISGGGLTAIVYSAVADTGDRRGIDNQRHYLCPGVPP